MKRLYDQSNNYMTDLMAIWPI